MGGGGKLGSQLARSWGLYKEGGEEALGLGREAGGVMTRYSYMETILRALLQVGGHVLT